ncbi:Kunitz trypsin inhibitor [Quillaja saponaria]|uniref:Kunitz trypsin inhibitor n=1 Tax=Quillaja saponaria TaxID=32244 RepID=A0AAD7Q5T6_QUISA|nr:Kunitz trypsin inhibitor [Quillaja saponaria]
MNNNDQSPGMHHRFQCFTSILILYKYQAPQSPSIHKLKRMKTSFLAALTTFLLFPLISAKPSVGQAQVLDTNGNPVEWGKNYYILPFIREPLGGGLILGSHNNRSCPLYVTQELSDVEKGLTVVFSPRISGLPTVSILDPLIITTTSPNIATCEILLVWLLVPQNRLWLVSTGGNSAALNSVFMIVPYKSYYYNIVFCPGLSVIPSMCQGLGMYYGKDGTRYLALGDDIEPFKFVLQKADDTKSQNPQYLETMA